MTVGPADILFYIVYSNYIGKKMERPDHGHSPNQRSNLLAQKQISIVVVDDHPVILHGVKSILDRCGDMTVIGEADDTVSGLDLIAAMRPDIAILDISLDGANGLDLIPQIKKTTTPVIYTTHDNADYIRQAFKSGARGYVLKVDPMQDLAEAVREAHSGRVYLSGSIAPGVLDPLFGQADDDTY